MALIVTRTTGRGDRGGSAVVPSTNTDNTWKHYGAVDPYFGVLTQERFKTQNLNDDTKVAFFDSGVGYVAELVAAIRKHLDPSFTPMRVLDFGCGVGRLTLPLARISGSVVGVDVSPAMLAEAEVNARDQGLDNVSFVEADDSLSRVTGHFDLIHSFIVFQHIPRPRGEALVRRMIDMLSPCGIGALHFTYAHSSETPAARRMLTRSFERVHWLYGLRNLVKRERFAQPLMQMNMYDLNYLVRLLQEAGIHRVFMHFTEASHFRYPLYGVVLYFANETLDVTTHS